MKRTFLSLIFVGAFLALPVRAAEKFPNPKNRSDALSQWGNLFRESMGPLMNPPIGEIDPVVAAAEKKIKEIIEKLAGERLRASPYRLETHIYDSSTMNAHMARLDDEGAGKPLRYSQVRRLLDKEKRPIYELALSTELLKKVDTEDELAFIIAHELTHLFEGHTEKSADNMEAAKKWWSSQSNEVVADYEGVKMMRGKYELSAALDVMNKLHGKTAADPAHFLYSGMGSHHHEGVRLSLLQGAIEQFRQAEPDSVRREKIPLGKNLKPQTYGRERIFSKSFEKNKGLVNELIDKYFLAEKFFPIESDEFLVSLDKAPKKYQKIFFSREKIGNDQLREAFLNGLDHIEKSRASSQVKVDALIKLMLTFDYSLPQQKQYEGMMWGGMTEKDIQRVRRFIAENSVGKNGWNPAKLYSSLQPSKIDYFVPTFFFGSPKVQDVFRPLAEKIPAWKRFYEEEIFSAVFNKKEIEYNKVADLIYKLGDRTEFENSHALPGGKPSLRDTGRENLLRKIQSVNWQEVLERQKPADALEFHRIFYPGTFARKDNEARVHTAWFRRLIDSLAPGFQTYDKRLTQLLMADYEKTDSRGFNSKLLGLLQYINNAAGGKLSPSQEKLMQKIIVDAAEYFYEKEPTWNTIAITFDSPEFYEQISKVLADPAVSPDQKKKVADWLSLFFADKKEFPLFEDQGRNTAMKERIRQYFANNWDKKTFESYLEKPSVPAVEKYLPTRIALEKKNPASAWETFKNSSDLMKYNLERKQGLLSLLGSDSSFRQTINPALTFADLGKTVDLVGGAYKKYVDHLKKMTGRERFGDGSMGEAAYLIETMLEKQNQATTYEEWKNTYLKIVERNSKVLDQSSAYRKEVGKYLQETWLNKMPPAQIAQELKIPGIRTALDPETVADHLVAFARQDLSGKLTDMNKAKALLERMEKDYEFIDNTELRAVFKNKFMATLNVQPGQASVLFPDLTKKFTSTELSSPLTEPVRGLSSLVALTRTQPVEDQRLMIDYLMGRHDSIPAFVEKNVKEIDPSFIGPVNNMLLSARARLNNGTIAERIIAANSFLAGPSGPIEDPKTLNALLEGILGDVPGENKALARAVADSVLTANGEMRSLAIAYILGQRNAGKAMSEADLLSSLLLAHGVPGIKLGQYLGFTSGFKEYAEHMASFQDQAAPLQYSEVIELLEERSKGKWPSHLKVVKALGFGSVNVAVELFDEKTGKTEVVSILRPNVEAATQESFRKMNALLKALSENKAITQDLSFLMGLSHIVEKSVTLEFNKDAAFEMQRDVFDRYDASIDGWKVESVEALRNESDGVFMKKANGITARKLLEKDPQTYRSAMRAMSQVEMDILLGIGKEGNPFPVPMHANPDFHDGQVIIDTAKKKVQILDFGQAVAITNAERDQGVDILRILSGAESPESARQLLEANAKAGGHNLSLTAGELQRILKDSSDRMDRFIKLLSHLSLNGYDLPLPVVHWVLGVNRQIELGNKIGVNNQAVFRNLILSRKIGVGQERFNSARVAFRSARSAAREIKAAAKNIGVACSHLYRSLSPLTK